MLVGGPQHPSPSAGVSGDQTPAQEDTTPTSPKLVTVHGMNGTKMETKDRNSLKRVLNVEEVYVLDASKEGNVGRFINVRGWQHQLWATEPTWAFQEI